MFIFFLCFSGSLYAADYQSEIDKFFNLYKTGNIEKAVASIYGTNPYISAVPDQVANVKTQLGSVKGLVGDIVEIHHIDTYKVANAFVHVTYIVTYDRQPIRFEFQYFKAKDGWRIYAFSFDQELDSDVQSLARKAALVNK